MSLERTIVVADDDEATRDLIASLLRDGGYDARPVPDGGGALDELEKLADVPCLLVLDLIMPTMSGFEVLDVLANVPHLARIPVIACTALLPPDMLPDGVEQFFVKPVALGALLYAARVICALDNATWPRARTGRRRTH